MTRLLALSALFLGACLFDSHHGTDPCKAVPQTGAAGVAPAFELRNPDTGVCQTFDTGGGTCDSSCGPCPEAGGVLLPNWPQCFGACDGLDEASCTANASCHAAYHELAAGDQSAPTFDSCWGIAPLAPIAGGSCAGLDSLTCAQHADCASDFDLTIGPSDGQTLTYLDCIPEPGNHPLDPGTCDSSGVLCNSAPPACPANTVPGVKDNCWSGYCIPTADCPPATLACEQLTTEAACQARAADCEPSYTGTNCTCDESGACTCQNESFDHCVTIGRL